MSEEFSFTGWLSSGIQGARDALQGSGGGLLPQEFSQHMQTSRKELLLAFRSLFDAAIEKTNAAKKSSRRKTTKIKVE